MTSSPAVSLEQVGPTVLIRWAPGAGSSDSLVMEVLESKATTAELVPFSRLSHSIRISQERLYSFRFRICDPTTGSCSQAGYEQIYAVVPRAGLVPASEITNWVPAAAGTHYPALKDFKGVLLFRPGVEFCKGRSSTDCAGFVKDTASGITTYRLVNVDSHGVGEMNPYNDEKRYAKSITIFYTENKEFKDTRYFEYMIYGYLKAATIQTRSAGGEYFMVLKPRADGWANSIDTALWAFRFLQSVRNGKNDNLNLRKYRWTLYSAARMLLNSFYQNYTGANAGLYIPYVNDPELGHPWRDGFFLSFAGNDYRTNPKVALGKFLESMEYLNKMAEILKDPGFAAYLNGPKTVELGNSLLEKLVAPGIQRLGAKAIGSNVQVRTFYNPERKYGDYAYDLVTEKRAPISDKTNFVKACGDFKDIRGGIGQVKHMYKLLFHDDTTVSGELPTPWDDGYEVRKGYGYRVCANRCKTQLPRIKEAYYQWKIGCCERFADLYGGVAPTYCKANMGQYNATTNTFQACTLKKTGSGWECR